MTPDSPAVVAVCAGARHAFSKGVRPEIVLTAGHGVEHDAHHGIHVQHLYDRNRDPARPNLRQVHLLERELLDELTMAGFHVGAGDLGENITTRNVRLVELAHGTLLRIGAEAIVKITGLREPCSKIDRFMKGLRRQVTARRNQRTFMKGAVMGVVIAGGHVLAGDLINIEPPACSFVALQPV